MSKVIIDEKIIDEILSRSVAEILPSKDEFRKLLLSGKKIKFYIGTDPTGTSLHLGHATNYIVLERLRKLGHQAIFLIGDFTARIGDPTDKKAIRKSLSRQEVVTNVKTWLKQIAPIVNLNDKTNPVSIVYNNDWLAKLNFEDVINLSAHFTVGQMLERDMFEKRITESKPIYVHEFFYPLMQGYDSVHLEVDMELCGNDQKFNALAGRTLLKKIKNKEKFVFITTLLENPITKEKMMSKSLGTGVFLDDSPKDMFGKIMAQADENIEQLFIDCTYLSISDIKKLIVDIDNPRDLKLILATEIVSIYHGKNIANKAKEFFIKTVSNKELPDTIKQVNLAYKQILLIDLLIALDLVSSKGEARRLISQGAIKLGSKDNLKKVIDIDYRVMPSPGLIIQRGKREFREIK
jgi:tyrosyl-tRNA synthetase